MKYVVTCIVGILFGAASYELSERLRWTRLGPRALVWTIALAVAAFASATLWS